MKQEEVAIMRNLFRKDVEGVANVNADETHLPNQKNQKTYHANHKSDTGRALEFSKRAAFLLRKHVQEQTCARVCGRRDHGGNSGREAPAALPE